MVQRLDTDLLFQAEEVRTEQTQVASHLIFALTVLAIMGVAWAALSPESFPPVTLMAFVAAGMSAIALFSAGVLWSRRQGRFYPGVKYLTGFIDLFFVLVVGWVAAEQISAGTPAFVPGFKTPAWFVMLLLGITPAFRYSPPLALFTGVGSQLVMLAWLGQGLASGRIEWTTAVLHDVFSYEISALVTFLRHLLLAALGGAVWMICRNSRRVVTSAVELQVGLAAEQYRRQQIQANVRRYFPPQLAATLAEGEGIPGLGGERRRLVILMSDIRNFTTAAEAMDPAQLVTELNHYFTEMVEILFRSGGTLIGFLGDGLIAVWGLPEAAPNDAERAVGASQQMIEHVGLLKQAGRFPGLGDMHIGIGIHLGEVMVGNIGSLQRMEFTVIGDAVNTTARVESLNKELHTELLITASVVEALGPAGGSFRPLGEYHVKGRSGMVQVYGL